MIMPVVIVGMSITATVVIVFMMTVFVIQRRVRQIVIAGMSFGTELNLPGIDANRQCRPG